MRTFPIAALVLAGALALGLGLRVMFSVAPASAPLLPTGATVGGVPQGHIYTGCADEPDDVNPYTAHSIVARRLIFSYTHDPLLEIDPVGGELRPALAERFEVAPDGSSCTFTLRQGAKFADGTPVTMEDALFGWELKRAGHLPIGLVDDAYARVERVDVLDPLRFRVHFRGVHYAATRAVGESWLVGQKRFFVARIAAMLAAGEPMPAVDTARFAALFDRIDQECGPGTGPYVLHNEVGGVSHWRRRQDVLLVRNEHCWRREVTRGSWNFAGIRTLWRDQASSLNALLLGEVDWFSSPRLTEVLAQHPRIAAGYEKLVYDYESLGVYRMVWNCATGPCADPRVRRALAMLCDRDGIVACFDGAAQKALAHAKPGRPEYPVDAAALPFDVAGSRRLLRDAGFDPAQGKPLRLVLLAMQGTEPLRRMVELFADACKQAGIELDLRARDLQGFVAEKKKRQWDGMLVLQSFRPWGDPYDFLHRDGHDNDGRWQHPEADRLAAAARAELDPARRAQLWLELHTLAIAEQPAALLVHPLASILRSRHLQGLVVGRNGLSIERAFVAAEHQRR
jgi:ABC-type transport system substrate-binding protein